MGDIDWQYLLFRFDGRINRAKFWSGVGALIVAYIVLGVLFAIDSSALRALVFLGFIALYWPGLAISIKRWHDRDKSGWWVLIGFVPVIGGIWALVETGFLEGTGGPNQYGPDPLGGGIADQPAM